MDLKTDIIKILKPIFGDSVIKIIEDNYDSNSPEDLITLAHHMLKGYMGEKNADNMLGNLIKRFPKLKIEVQ
jgi:hypothetical protein